MSESDQGGAGRREVAYRLFAAEFDDADFSHSESDEERAPNYVITPTGARVNRLFVVGVLTEVEAVSEDVLRARVVDPTGAFVLYAGQYQPDEQAFLDGARTPMFVAVTGKARTFQPEDSKQIYTSIRPESISEVDAETRDRWTVQTAEQTIDRVGRMAAALDSDLRGEKLQAALAEDDVDEGLAAGIPKAIDHYGTTAGYLAELRSLAVDAARLIAGDIDEVEGLSVAPGEGTDTVPGELPTAELDLVSPAETATTEPETAGTTTTAAAETDDGSTTGESEPATAGPEPTAETTDTAASESETAEDMTSSETTETDREPAVATADAGTSGSTQQHGSTDTVDESSTAESETSTASDLTDSPGADSTTGADSEESHTTSTDEDADDIGDFEPGEFELDEEEREEIEEEFGTEFQSGSEVPEPGEADIETPDPEEREAETDAPTSEASGTAATTEPAGTETAAEPADADETTTDIVEQPDDEPSPPSGDEEAPATTGSNDEDEAASDAEDVDLEDAAVDLMGELDEGDGADRDAVIEALVDRYGTSEADAEDAIQDALMDGRCYEPDDDRLTPI